jgi:hypothetical protein
LASRPRYFSFCSGVPYFSSSSHHHSDAGGNRARGDLGDDHRLRLGRKAQAAMLLADQHAQKTVFLEERPDFRAHVGAVVTGIPIVDHGADLLGRAIEECLFFGGQRQRTDIEELFPARLAGEQLGIPADGAGVERLLLGARHFWQDGLDHAIGRPGDSELAQRLERQRQHGQARQQRQDQPARTGLNAERGEIDSAEQPEADQHCAPLPERRPAHGQNRRADQK